MSDLPVSLPAELEPAFLAAFDPPGKLVAAIGALGPVSDRDVLVVDAAQGPIIAGLTAAGARLSMQPKSSPLRLEAKDASADVVLCLWSTFRLPPVPARPVGVRGVEPSVRPVPEGRLPGPGRPLFLGVRDAGGVSGLPVGGVRRARRNARGDPQAREALAQHRRLPSIPTVIDQPARA